MDDWRQLPVFRQLDEAAHAQLAGQAGERVYETGQTVATAGNEWPYVMYIVEGQIEAVLHSAEGRLLIPFVLRPGRCFWSHTVFCWEVMPLTLVARTQSLVYLWPEHTVMPLVRPNPDALWDLCQTASQLVVRTTAYIESLVFEPNASRLARLLLREFAPVEGELQMRSLSLDQMGAAVGTTREVVCRILREWARAGVIHLTRNHLGIRDMRRLHRMAGHSPPVEMQLLETRA